MVVDEYVYLIVEAGEERCKIGRSLDPKSRLASLQTGNPRTLRLAASFLADGPESASAYEAALHAEFADLKCDGGGSEWFHYSDRILQRFNDANWHWNRDTLSEVIRGDSHCVMSGPVEIRLSGMDTPDEFRRALNCAMKSYGKDPGSEWSWRSGDSEPFAFVNIKKLDEDGDCVSVTPWSMRNG
jgi:hypothetical protein